MGQRPELITAKRLLLISVLSYLTIGVIGILVSLQTSSKALLADAFDSLADMLISLIVVIGFSFSQRFFKDERSSTYFKIEVLAAFTVAILTIFFAAYLLYLAIQTLVDEHKIYDANIAIAFALGFGFVSTIITFFKFIYARRLRLLSLKADALNSIKDTLSSFIAAIAIYLAEKINYSIDLIGAMIIAGFIATAAFPIIKESSLILTDVYNNPQLKEKIIELSKEIPYITRILSINCRRIGYSVAVEIEVEIEAKITVEKMHEAIKSYEEAIKSRFSNIGKVLIVVKSIN